MQVVHPFIVTLAVFVATWEYFLQALPVYMRLSFPMLPGSQMLAATFQTLLRKVNSMSFILLI